MTFALTIKTAEDKAAEALTAWRASASCSPLQGKLALGEAQWAQVESVLADPATPWAMRQAIGSATVWMRKSQHIDTLAWTLGLTESEVDDLFRLAMTIEA
jgi:hypothetical protein